MDNKHKHLEFIQTLIERMAANSFTLKTWAVTIVAAILAWDSKDGNQRTIIISFIPVFAFWLLDGFYLQKERLCRSLYEKVRKLHESEIDFNMNTHEFAMGKNTWIRSIASITLIIFYSTLIISIFLIKYFLP